jgi:hypothetical protein
MVAGQAGEDTLGAPNIVAAFNAAKSAVTNLRANNQRAVDKANAERQGRLANSNGTGVADDFFQRGGFTSVQTAPDKELIVSEGIARALPKEPNENTQVILDLADQIGIAIPGPKKGIIYGPTKGGVSEEQAARSRLAIEAISAGVAVLPTATNAKFARQVTDLLEKNDLPSSEDMKKANLNDFMVEDFKNTIFAGRDQVEQMMRSGKYGPDKIAAVANTLAYQAELSSANTIVEKAVNLGDGKTGGFAAMADYYNAATGKSWSWNGKSPLEQMQEMSKDVAAAAKSKGYDANDPAVRIARDDAMDALGFSGVARTGMREAKEKYKSLGRSQEAQMIDDVANAVYLKGVEVYFEPGVQTLFTGA